MSTNLKRRPPSCHHVRRVTPPWCAQQLLLYDTAVAYPRAQTRCLSGTCSRQPNRHHQKTTRASWSHLTYESHHPSRSASTECLSNKRTLERTRKTKLQSTPSTTYMYTQLHLHYKTYLSDPESVRSTHTARYHGPGKPNQGVSDDNNHRTTCITTTTLFPATKTTAPQKAQTNGGSPKTDKTALTIKRALLGTGCVSDK